MNEYEELRKLALEADRRGDRAGAELVLKRMDELETPQKDISHAEGLAAHGSSSLALGFGDELGAGVAAAVSYLDPRAGTQSAFEGQSFGQRYQNIRNRARERMDDYKAQNTGLATGAEIVGGLLSPGGLKGAQALKGLKGADLVNKSTAVGGLLGGASGAGYSNAGTVEGVGQDAAVGGLLGAVTGHILPRVGNRFAQAKANAMAGKSSDPYVNAVNILEGHGIPLTTGQKSGVNWMKGAESTLEEVPWGGKPLQVSRETSRRAFQRQLFRMTGLDDGSDMLTRETLDKLNDSLADDYAKALRGRSIDLADESFIDDLASIEADNTRFVDASTKEKVRRIVSDFLEEAEKAPNKDGQWYQSQRSLFAKRALKHTEVADLYGDLKHALDESFRRAAGKDVKGNLDARWGQYKQLERLYNRVAGGSEGAEGFIPPSQLAREAGKNPGTKEWQELTRAAATVLPDRMANSGTAQRNMMLGLLGGAAFDPMSLIYGPAISRGLSGQLAAGRSLDATKLIPGGSLLTNPNNVRAAPLAGLLSE